ncbi:MAG: hypothetical protein ACI9DO_003692 [Reinekea sp.]|jgi:hypothetical protein|uniref:hypothetical protein n=1 Tax=Reinekea sp. TaxID=1970455 RepID=UPI00398910E3
MNKFWEIAQLSDGSYVLRSSEEDSAPIVKIQFSADAKENLGDLIHDVAKAMIGAGVQVATGSFEPEEDEPNTVH